MRRRLKIKREYGTNLTCLFKEHSLWFRFVACGFHGYCSPRCATYVCIY